MLEYKSIIALIFAIGAAQAIFLFFILLKKKENSFANKFLAVTMLVFAIDLIAGIIFLAGFINNIPWILGINSTLPYLYGPLIYLYIIFLIHRRESFLQQDYCHFIPFIIVQLYGLLFFYFEPSSYQLSLLDFTKQPPWHIQLVGMLIPVSGLIYMFLTIRVAYNFNKQIKNSLSNIDNIDLSWLLYLVGGTAVIWLVVLLSYLIGYAFGEQLQANLMIYITISIFLYTLAIKSYKQPEIKVENTSQDSYKKSGLSDEKAEQIKQSLLDVMNTDKPFLDAKLNLNQLAEKIDISTHNLSEIINTKIEQNFYDFINSYRVEEVKKLITEDKNDKYNLLAHGFEAGFSSKSAYYSAFKKFTGMTPAQFKNKKM
ncbi:MAG: AraC family transcriptional regulator [Ignavibacteriae bacterium]|nr:AraC family transcriptional regulator [Ignavibacteriota bacterium]MCB9208389.1 AraC family transcriptional regulator [Ignavibacteriales bacterium]